jgi:4-amino-4-deoxy-L-arabinose transferase-like glycosyltransferase
MNAPGSFRFAHARAWHRFGLALAGTFLAGLYLPKLLTIGTFTDGLVYAILARNLALGYGSPWALRYGEADSFWIAGVRGDAFYDHPPLMMWLEAGLFRVLGDYWWVEELFSALVMLALFGVVWGVWRVLRPAAGGRAFGWLAVLGVASVPFVCLCVSNNYLDGALTVLGLFSFYHLCRAIRHDNPAGWLWAGLGIFAGFLMKGPFILFLLSAPVWYALTHDRTRAGLWRAGRQTALLTGLVAGLTGLLLLYAPARDFFGHYLDQQIGNALRGTRVDQGDASFTRLGRFYIVVELLRNLARLSLVGAVGWVLVRSQLGRTPAVAPDERRLIGWLLLIGLSGLLPILASSKQNPWYIVPSAPYFALALVVWMAGYLRQWLDTRPALPPAALRGAAVGVLALAFVAAAWRLGVLVGTTPAQRRGVEEILALEQVPAGSRVAVTDESLILQEVILNLSLQRFRRIALTMDTTRTPYRLRRLTQPLPPGYRPLETLASAHVQFLRAPEAGAALR